MPAHNLPRKAVSIRRKRFAPTKALHVQVELPLADRIYRFAEDEGRTVTSVLREILATTDHPALRA